MAKSPFYKHVTARVGWNEMRCTTATDRNHRLRRRQAGSGFSLQGPVPIDATASNVWPRLATTEHLVTAIAHVYVIASRVIDVVHRVASGSFIVAASEGHRACAWSARVDDALA